MRGGTVAGSGIRGIVLPAGGRESSNDLVSIHVIT